MPKSNPKKKLEPRDEFAQKFGKTLRISRENENKTLLDITKLTDLDPSILSKMERGVTIPRLDTACKVARALGISLDVFIDDA